MFSPIDSSIHIQLILHTFIAAQTAKRVEQFRLFLSLPMPLILASCLCLVVISKSLRKVTQPLATASGFGIFFFGIVVRVGSFHGSWMLIRSSLRPFHSITIWFQTQEYPFRCSIHSLLWPFHAHWSIPSWILTVLVATFRSRPFREVSLVFTQYRVLHLVIMSYFNDSAATLRMGILLDVWWFTESWNLEFLLCTKYCAVGYTSLCHRSCHKGGMLGFSTEVFGKNLMVPELKI
jgi:hypothetical protein